MVTLEEIAAAAGVSRNTVSRALNGKTKEIWPSTVRRANRIRRIAARMGYRPNSAARAMGRGRFGCAALLLSTEPGRSTLPGRLLDGVHNALAGHDMSLALAKMPDEALTDEAFVPKVLRELMADGLLINYNREVPAKMIELIDDQGIPAIWINSKREKDCVHPDDLGAGQAATEHLLSLGHRHIAYVSFSPVGSPKHYSEADRQAGYEAAMARAGLKPRLIQPGAGEEPGDRLAWARRWLAGPDRPTGIVAYAHGPLVKYAASTLGLRAPDDLSVLSFAEQQEVGLGEPDTTMVIPAAAMGKTAVEMLVERLRAPSEGLEPRVLPIALVNGRTTGPPPQGAPRPSGPPFGVPEQ